MKNLVIALALIVAGCGQATPDSGTAAPAAAGFPVTVLGTDGRQVTLAGEPGAVVSLSATHTEMLYAIGAAPQIAATDLTSNYPPPAEATPKVDAFNFDVEEVASLEPDLVVLAFDSGEVESLERLDIPALLLAPAKTLDEMFDQIMVIGAATGHTDEAARVVQDMRDSLETILSDVPDSDPPVTVFHEVDATLYSPNSETFLGDIYLRLGLINIADEVPDDLGAGYVQVSEELIFAADPDVIFLGDAEFGESIETVSSRPGWDTLSAVQNSFIYELDGDVVGRWGPRTVDLVADIAQAAREVTGTR